MNVELLSFFFFSSRRRHTRCGRDWSSDVCSSDLEIQAFLLMEDLLAQLQPGLIRQHLAPLRTRLEAMLASGGAKKNEIRNRIRILRMPARSVEPKHFQIVCSAALSRKRLKLV